MNPAKSRRLLILPAALLLLGAAVGLARRPRAESQRERPMDDTPEACISRLLAAEERGDSRAYLECFVPPRRGKVETAWQGRSPAEVAAELHSQSAGLVGRVVTDLEFSDPHHAGLTLERIHKDHTRRQHVELACEGGPWQIVDLSTPDSQTPAIPYGTPVYGRSQNEKEH